MKVILLTDVKKVGKANEIVEVKDGYARNCIIKPGYGVEVNSKTLNDLKLKKINEEKVKEETYEEALNTKKILESKPVPVFVRVGKNGKLFGAVSSKEIADAVKEYLKIDLDKRKIQMKAPIKQVCNTFVKVKLHTSVIAEIKLNIIELN